VASGARRREQGVAPGYGSSRARRRRRVDRLAVDHSGAAACRVRALVCRPSGKAEPSALRSGRGRPHAEYATRKSGRRGTAAASARTGALDADASPERTRAADASPARTRTADGCGSQGGTWAAASSRGPVVSTPTAGRSCCGKRSDANRGESGWRGRTHACRAGTRANQVRSRRGCACRRIGKKPCGLEDCRITQSRRAAKEGRCARQDGRDQRERPSQGRCFAGPGAAIRRSRYAAPRERAAFQPDARHPIPDGRTQGAGGSLALRQVQPVRRGAVREPCCFGPASATIGGRAWPTFDGYWRAVQGYWKWRPQLALCRW
jgi:hypothetical protein